MKGQTNLRANRKFDRQLKTSSGRIGLPIHSTFQLQIEYSILSGTFGTNHSPGGEELEDSNSILILF